MMMLTKISQIGIDFNVREVPGFGPAAEVLLLRQKDPKPVTPRPASSNWADANHGRARELR